MFKGITVKMLRETLFRNQEKIDSFLNSDEIPWIIKGNKLELNLLGDGEYGIILETRNPRKVIKLTTDISEATFASTYIAKKWEDEPKMQGINIYYKCAEIDTIEVRNNTLSVFIIVKEETDALDELLRHTSIKYDKDLFARMIKFNDEYLSNGRYLFKLIKAKPKGYQFMTEEALTTVSLRDYLKRNNIPINNLNKMFLIKNYCEDMTLNVLPIFGHAKSYELASSLDFLMRKEGIYICDLHFDNIRVAKNRLDESGEKLDEFLVVSDPGHMIPMPWSEIVNPVKI